MVGSAILNLLKKDSKCKILKKSKTNLISPIKRSKNLFKEKPDEVYIAAAKLVGY